MTSIVFGPIRDCSFFMPRLSDAAILDSYSYAHVVDEVLRCRIVCMEESERDHYMCLHTALAKCERCLAFWLHHGANLNRGAANHPDWIALEWARASNASPEILRLLTPSVWPSLRPRAFCAGVEKEVMISRPWAHLLDFSPMKRARTCVQLHAAGSLCKVCAQAWLDRGADTSKGTP